MKRKRICSLMLLLVMITRFAIGSNTLTVKAWKQTDHEASVQKLSSHALFDSKINLSLVKKAAGYTDTKYGTVENDNWEHKANGLHAVGNYVANLKFLYGVVWRYIYKTDANPISYFTNQNDPKEWMKQVPEPVIKAVEKEAALESTRKGKASRILGLAVHLMGDIYAHRVIVPTSTISGASANASGNKLGKKDFYTNDQCQEHSYAELEYWCKTRLVDLDHEDIPHKWCCVSAAINAGLLETMDIKYFMIVKDGSKYEDNINYYPSRFNTATNWTIEHVLDSLTAKKTNIGKSFFLSESTTSVFSAKLHGFSSYCTDAGALNE